MTYFGPSLNGLAAGSTSFTFGLTALPLRRRQTLVLRLPDRGVDRDEDVSDPAEEEELEDPGQDEEPEGREYPTLSQLSEPRDEEADERGNYASGRSLPRAGRMWRRTQQPETTIDEAGMVTGVSLGSAVSEVTIAPHSSAGLHPRRLSDPYIRRPEGGRPRKPIVAVLEDRRDPALRCRALEVRQNRPRTEGAG